MTHEKNEPISHSSFRERFKTSVLWPCDLSHTGAKEERCSAEIEKRIALRRDMPTIAMHNLKCNQCIYWVTTAALIQTNAVTQLNSFVRFHASIAFPLPLIAVRPGQKHIMPNNISRTQVEKL